MNVVIPLLNYSSNNYAELKYCLRGVEEHLGEATVYIIGGLPIWAKNIKHIEFSEDKNIEWKERNIYLKTKEAFKYVDEMLFMNDDHFLLSPFNYLHHKGSMLENKAQRHPNSSYGYTLFNTLQLLGKDINNFDTHCPIIYKKEQFAKLEQLNWNNPFGYAVKTCYVYLNGLQNKGEYYPDVKYFDSIEDVSNRLYFSTSDSCGLKKLKEIYPNKSKYEQ